MSATAGSLSGINAALSTGSNRMSTISIILYCGAEWSPGPWSGGRVVVPVQYGGTAAWPRSALPVRGTAAVVHCQCVWSVHLRKVARC
jgi:hypothetical protein